MTYRLDMRPQAMADIAQEAAWYEEREPGLGDRFLSEVADRLERVVAEDLWPLPRYSEILFIK